MYTEDIAETIAAFSLNHYLDTDDAQLQKNTHIVDPPITLVNLNLCVAVIKDWCSSRRLQLNDDKTELILFCSRSYLKILTLAETSLNSIQLSLSQQLWFRTSAFIWITN